MEATVNCPVLTYTSIARITLIWLRHCPICPNKVVEWCWTSTKGEDLKRKREPPTFPDSALTDPGRPFSVVCDASDFAVGCAMLQTDVEGRERLIDFEFRQLKAAEKNYPVHDKDLLAMKYALVQFRIHMLGSKPFAFIPIMCIHALPPNLLASGIG